MNVPLVQDDNDQKWLLLKKILGIVTSRRVKQEMAKQGIVPMEKAGAMLRIVLIAIFFSVEISYVVEEMKKRKSLRAFALLGEVPDAPQIYRFLGKYRAEQFMGLVSGVLNSICARKGRGGVILVDSTDLSVDLNWFRKRINKADLEDREFKWGYSPSKGYYIGYKLTMAIEYPSLKPLAFLLHPGSPHDMRLFEEVVEELRRRRIARNGDTMICDRGYWSLENCVMGIARFKIVPVIFTKKTFRMEKLQGKLSYPLSVFNGSCKETAKAFFKQLVRSLKVKLENWEIYKPIRGCIEDLFKVTKQAFGLTTLHRYTERSVKKIVFCMYFW
jgi:hypothetical protein